MVLSSLIKKRGTVKSKLTNFVKYLEPLKELKKLSTLQLTELNVRLSKIEELYTEFDNYQTDIEHISETPDEQSDEREKFETLYFRSVAVAREMLERHESGAVSSSASGFSTAHGGKYQGHIMNKCFLEIAYKAELNTDEHPELLEVSAQKCDEDPSTRHIAIAELRDMIFHIGECIPHRTDDKFLVRFLRARDFIVPRAHRLMVRYYNFRKQYPNLYEGVDLWGLMKVKDAYECTLSDRPEYGRISIIRCGTWDPSEFPVEELVRAGLVSMEIGLRQPKIQVFGGTLIVDLEGVTLRHVATLTPAIAYQIVAGLGIAIPCRVNSCHLINYSWILKSFFYLFKRFIPREFYDRIFFHGYDVKSLQQHIDLECLPERYGGKDRTLTSFAQWLSKVKQYRTEDIDKEMKALGYVVKE